jgi:hypothetical protein
LSRDTDTVGKSNHWRSQIQILQDDWKRMKMDSDNNHQAIVLYILVEWQKGYFWFRRWNFENLEFRKFRRIWCLIPSPNNNALFQCNYSCSDPDLLSLQQFIQQRQKIRA